MNSFKDFIRTEVELIQAQLEGLLLLYADECKEDTVPSFVLRRLKDNPAANARSWSFLVDPRNREELPNQSRWLLDRVLNKDWLRDDFLRIKATSRCY